MKLHGFELPADCHQPTLQDEADAGDLSGAWTEAATAGAASIPRVLRRRQPANSGQPPTRQ